MCGDHDQFRTGRLGVLADDAGRVAGLDHLLHMRLTEQRSQLGQQRLRLFAGVAAGVLLHRLAIAGNQQAARGFQRVHQRQLQRRAEQGQRLTRCVVDAVGEITGHRKIAVRPAHAVMHDQHRQQRMPRQPQHAGAEHRQLEQRVAGNAGDNQPAAFFRSQLQHGAADMAVPDPHIHHQTFGLVIQQALQATLGQLPCVSVIRLRR
ncbi:hypothetical protein D3C71_1036920 [compost metagenome]